MKKIIPLIALMALLSACMSEDKSNSKEENVRVEIWKNQTLPDSVIAIEFGDTLTIKDIENTIDSLNKYLYDE